MNNIQVIDSIMGSGKTMYIHSMLRASHEEDVGRTFREPGHQVRKFLVVVPYLAEVQRYIKNCSELRFKEPKYVKGTKLSNLISLIREGENIVTTHTLFLMMTDECHGALKANRYELIDDEALECVTLYKDLKPDDLTLLKDHGLVTVCDNSTKLKWNHEVYPKYNGTFNNIKTMCDTGSLTAIGKDLFHVFPSDYLRCFTKVTICTYLFEGSTFWAYLKSEGITPKLMTLNDGRLVSNDEAPCEAARKAQLEALIKVYKGDMNKVGDRKHRSQPLSHSWYGKAEPGDLKRLQSSVTNFFERKAQTRSKDNCWTTYKSAKGSVAGKGYTKGFISCNARATDEYAEKASLAYLCNWFCHPSLVRYFDAKGVALDQELFALSALIQWIWRSRIRRDEPIHLFLPSERMRTLLMDWLRSDLRGSLSSEDQPIELRAA